MYNYRIKTVEIQYELVMMENVEQVLMQNLKENNFLFVIDSVILICLKIGTRDALSINFDNSNNWVLTMRLFTFGNVLKQEKKENIVLIFIFNTSDYCSVEYNTKSYIYFIKWSKLTVEEIEYMLI